MRSGVFFILEPMEPSSALPSWRVIKGRSWQYVRLADLAQIAEQRGPPVNWAAPV